MRTLTLALIMAAGLSAADLDNNTVTVTASRPVSVLPDQVQILVQLTTARDAGLDDVLGKLKGIGVVAANLTGVYGSATDSRWSFMLPVSFSGLKTTLANLVQLQRSTGPQPLTFYVSGAQVSETAQAAQACPLPALVSDARKQADTMAAAAGMKTGAIVSLSNEPPAIAAADVTVPVVIDGDFSVALGLVPGIPYVAPVAPSSCSLTVQFRLL